MFAEEYGILSYQFIPQKSCGLNFDIAAEEMRRLKTPPSEEEWTILYGLYMQVLHGDTPNEDIYRKTTTVFQCYRMTHYSSSYRGKGSEQIQCMEGKEGYGSLDTREILLIDYRNASRGGKE